MKTFTDNAGRSWTVEINVAAIKRVRSLIPGNVNLLEVVEGTLIERLIRDPVLLCDIIYAVCKPQADEQSVSDEEFGRAMAGDAIEHATQALLEELVSFSPSPRDRKNLGRVLEATRKVMDKARDLIETKLDSGALEQAADQALAEWREAPNDPAGRLGGLHFNRAMTRRFLGRDVEANSDLREAFRLDPTDPVIALGFAMEAETQPDLDAAIAAVSSLPLGGEWTDQVRFAVVMLRLRRRAEGDLEQARAEVEQLCARLGSVTPTTHRADIVRMALRVCYEQGRTSDGPAIVIGVTEGALPEYQRAALLARAHMQAGAREEATKIAKTALRALGEDASWFDRREAALLAQDSGLHSEAVQLWRSVLPPDDAGSDTTHLVRAAYFAGEWRTVLDVCACVRAAGRTTRRHLEVEVEVLAASREVARATSLLADWVAKHTNDRHAVLHLSVLALRDGKHDLAVFDESRLPPVSEILDPGEGAALVFVLRRGPSPERSLEIAYSLYRRFPEHPDSHRALVACVFDLSATPLTIERHQRVGDGAAVCVRRHDEQPRWVYIESAPDPAGSRSEFPSAHEFVRAMWDRSKGDMFEYLGHQYEILEDSAGYRRFTDPCR